MMRVKSEVVEERQLFESTDEFRMLVGDMFLDESNRFEELCARLASELALVLLLDVGLGDFSKLILICFPAVVTGVYLVTLEQQRHLRIQPFDPALI